MTIVQLAAAAYSRDSPLRVRRQSFPPTLTMISSGLRVTQRRVMRCDGGQQGEEYAVGRNLQTELNQFLYSDGDERNRGACPQPT